LDEEFGRLRAAVIGPDGALYVSTSNADGEDQIIRVAPGG
jgi:glucose/arabinose dehydrogenase